MKDKSLKETSIMKMPNNQSQPQSSPPVMPIPTKIAKSDPQSFKCPICGNVYNSKEEIEEHMHEHTP